jgi:hypothetical protein
MTTKYGSAVTSFIVLAAIASPLHAEEGAVSLSTYTAPPGNEGSEEGGALYERGGLSGVGLVVGGKLGGGFGQPFSELGTTFVGELELGFTLPPLRRSIEIFIAGQYAAPTTEKKGIADESGPGGTSRLPGEWEYSLTERQAIVTLGGLYRLPLPTPLFRPYLALGGRMYLLRTEVNGRSGGETFGGNDETATKFGFYGALGGELHVGPGAVLLEVQTGYAGVDGFVLRDTNVGSLNVALGYRLFI